MGRRNQDRPRHGRETRGKSVFGIGASGSAAGSDVQILSGLALNVSAVGESRLGSAGGQTPFIGQLLLL